jgi:hypothetical protein
MTAEANVDLDADKLGRLKVFLNVFGLVSILLFGTLFVLTALDSPLMQEGGALRFLRWQPLAKHIELMIEIIYLVWGVFFFLAARNPLAYLSFIDFTIWANLAHGVLMIPQSHAIEGFNYKLGTDVAYCLVLAVGLWLLRPSGTERRAEISR